MTPEAKKALAASLGSGCALILAVCVGLFVLMVRTCDRIKDDFEASKERQQQERLEKEKQREIIERPTSPVDIDRANGLVLGMEWEPFKANLLEMARSQDGVYVAIDQRVLGFPIGRNCSLRFSTPNKLDLNLTHPVKSLSIERTRVRIGPKSHKHYRENVTAISWHVGSGAPQKADPLFNDTVRDFQRLTGQEGSSSVKYQALMPLRLWTAVYQGNAYAVYETERARGEKGVHAAIHDERGHVPPTIKKYHSEPRPIER